MSNCTDPRSLGSSDCSTFQFSYLSSIYLGIRSNEGVENEFANQAAVTKTTFKAKVDLANTAPFTALFPLHGNFKNVTDETGDEKSESFDDDTSQFIAQGIRTFEGYIPNGTPEMVEAIGSFRNFDTGAYIGDVRGNLGYQTDNEGVKVKLIPLEAQTIVAELIPATSGGSAAKIRVRFTFSVSEYRSAKFRYIKQENLDFNPTSNIDIPSLIDLKGSMISASGTSVVFKVRTTDDIEINEALVFGDVAFDADGTPVAATALSYNATTLEYTATVATITAAETYTLNLTKSGFYTYIVNKETVLST